MLKFFQFKNLIFLFRVITSSQQLSTQLRNQLIQDRLSGMEFIDIAKKYNLSNMDVAYGIVRRYRNAHPNVQFPDSQKSKK